MSEPLCHICYEPAKQHGAMQTEDNKGKIYWFCSLECYQAEIDAYKGIEYIISQSEYERRFK